MEPYSEQKQFMKNAPQSQPSDELDYFFSHAYHDMRFFLKTITRYNANSYTYFGDMQKHLFFISDNLRDDFGFKSNIVENLIGEWEKRIYRQKHLDEFRHNIQTMIAEKRSVHDLRYQVLDKDGKALWVRCCGEIQWNEDRSEPIFFAGRISRQDDFFVVDPVTNFPSEPALLQHLDEIQSQGRSCFAIGFCLNHISQINTMKGRTLADRLIHNISTRLMDQLSGSMSFYRLPGVRCMAIADSNCTLDKDNIITQIRSIVEASYKKAGIKVPCPCSFASMNFPQTNMSPSDLQEKMVSLIKMSRHDQRSVCIEDTEENSRKIYEFSKIEMAICQDVLNGMQHFRPVIQPVVSTDTGKIIAGETLMRWQFEGKDISPAIFIPILEKDNMIHLAGRWIFEQAVEACSKILPKIPDFYLTVNVSLAQLYDDEFLSLIPDTLQKYHLSGRHLVLEMTESCMDQEPEKLMALMEACEKLGIRLALDDFGTGYSSLRVLLRYPTDIIKLDRTLLLEMTESTDKMNFISSIVFACHRFGKTVCMEGVENAMQNQLVKDACCDMIQGFYYYKPTELDDLYNMI